MATFTSKDQHDIEARATRCLAHAEVGETHTVPTNVGDDVDKSGSFAAPGRGMPVERQMAITEQLHSWCQGNEDEPSKYSNDPAEKNMGTQLGKLRESTNWGQHSVASDAKKIIDNLPFWIFSKDASKESVARRRAQQKDKDT